MTHDEEHSILSAITNLAQDVGKVQSKQNDMHKDVKDINKHLETSNNRLSDVEHEIMTWKTRFITSFAIVVLSIPFIVEESRTLILSIVT